MIYVLCSFSLIKMAQKEHALARFSKLNSSALEKHGVQNSKWTLRRRGAGVEGV